MSITCLNHKGRPTINYLIINFILLQVVLSALVAAASAAPADIVPYVHQEIEAEPYIHLEPALDDSVLGLTPEAQGVIAGRSLPQTAPVVNYNPAPINYNPAPVNYNPAPINYNAGGCYNNLGEGVPCRTQF